MKYFVLDGSGYKASCSIDNDILIVQNGLISRKVEITTGTTLSLYNLATSIEMISAPIVDYKIFIGDERRSAGGEFKFIKAETSNRRALFGYIPTPTMTEPREYPPKGAAYDLTYRNVVEGIEVTCHYEIYDEVPTVMKQVDVTNISETPLIINNIAVETLNIANNRDKIFVDSNYNAAKNISAMDYNTFSKHFARYHYDVLEVAPLHRMNVKIAPRESLQSVLSFITLLTAEYYEQRLIEIKTVYKYLAPWTTDSVLFFHLIANSSKAIRAAVDQCVEVGAEMVIQSFGSGVRMESHNPAYLARIAKCYDYGHQKGLRMGAYTLAYVKNYMPVRGHEALNHDRSQICRCLANRWADKYTESVLNFIDKTNADAIEIDGPYGMLMCGGGKTHHHSDFTDSQYKQWAWSVDKWYRELKNRNVYINAPDWHFLNGINRCPVGYEEIAFSEGRQEQLLLSRIYYYKGTFMKSPAMNWGFVPLNVYHGGGGKAVFFPTDQNAFDFDWAMAQIVASGVWPTLRGRKIYDCEQGKNILIKWISIYKQYRQLLNGITVHFMPPTVDMAKHNRTKGLDAIMNQKPTGDDRGFVMFFNQTDAPIKQRVNIPVYYTGLTDLESPPAPIAGTKNSDVEYPIYGEEIAPLVIKIKHGEERRTYVRDEAIVDKALLPIEVGMPTGKLITVCEKGERQIMCELDSNGSIGLEIELAPMTYNWYIIKAR